MITDDLTPEEQALARIYTNESAKRIGKRMVRRSDLPVALARVERRMDLLEEKGTLRDEVRCIWWGTVRVQLAKALGLIKIRHQIAGGRA